MSKKLGRPPIAKGKRRSVFLRVRVTSAEREALRLDAKQAGLSVSDYLRKILQGRKQHAR